jgi:hypothetical protein
VSVGSPHVIQNFTLFFSFRISDAIARQEQ